MKQVIKLVEVLGLTAWRSIPTPGPQDQVRCLLVEGSRSLLLVEIGLGNLDCIAPRRRLGPSAAMRQRGDAHRTMRHQLCAAGYRPDDVSDIVVSRFHKQHSGGLHDFPTAKVHALPAAAMLGPEQLKRLLPDPARLTIPQGAANRKFGFNTYPIEFETLELSLVDLPSESPFHQGVLLPFGDGKLFHVGTAISGLDELDSEPTFGRDAWGVLTNDRPFSRLQTRLRLRSLYRNSQTNLTFVSSIGETHLLNATCRVNLPVLEPSELGTRSFG